MIATFCCGSMGLSYSAAVGGGSGVVPCRTSCLNQARVSLRFGEALALNQRSSVVAAARGCSAAVTNGRPLSAPLTEDVARKARRAKGSGGDYDPSSFPIAHSDFVIVEPGSRRAANVLNQVMQPCDTDQSLKPPSQSDVL